MFIVSQQRKKYTPEYRREAANLVIESQRPIAHVAKEIGVSAGLLGRWVKLERERRGSSDGMSESDLRAENARLRRELAEARECLMVCVWEPIPHKEISQNDYCGETRSGR